MISNSDDTIDSRDVIARIGELSAKFVDLTLAQDEEALDEWKGEYGTELEALESLAEGAEGHCADWKRGEQLIRDSYFETYAQELAEDIGAIPDGTQWPCTYIDWEAAALALQQDYTGVDYDGVTYWTR
ncbi:MAG: hypothetical protein ACREA0_01605 [bacterium]